MKAKSIPNIHIFLVYYPCVNIKCNFVILFAWGQVLLVFYAPIYAR